MRGRTSLKEKFTFHSAVYNKGKTVWLSVGFDAPSKQIAKEFIDEVGQELIDIVGGHVHDMLMVRFGRYYTENKHDDGEEEGIVPNTSIPPGDMYG